MPPQDEFAPPTGDFGGRRGGFGRRGGPGLRSTVLYAWTKHSSTQTIPNSCSLFLSPNGT